MWTESSANKSCANSDVRTDIVSQGGCQAICERVIECVGISYTHKFGLNNWCYLCKDDTLTTAGNEVGFYRRPGKLRALVSVHWKLFIPLERKFFGYSYIIPLLLLFILFKTIKFFYRLVRKIIKIWKERKKIFSISSWVKREIRDVFGHQRTINFSGVLKIVFAGKLLYYWKRKIN